MSRRSTRPDLRVPPPAMVAVNASLPSLGHCPPGAGNRLGRLPGRLAALALLLAFGALAALADARPALAEEVYVLDPDCCGAPGRGGLSRVDSRIGRQNLVASRGLFDHPKGIALAPDRSIVVINDGKVSTGMLYVKGVTRVDPATGAQTVVPTGATFLRGISGLAVAHDGTILVATYPELPQFDPTPGG